MEMVILMKQVNIFKDFTNILIKNLFSGSSLNTSSNSCTPRKMECVGEPDPCSFVVQSIMWPCVARLQTVWALTWQDTGLTELSTASYLAIVLCPGLKCASTMADMTQDISSKARVVVKVVLACPRARNIEPSEFILAWSNFVYSHLS